MRFMSDVKLSEARAFYGFQIAMENIHSEMYSLLIETYIKDKDQKNKLFTALDNFSVHQEKKRIGLLNGSMTNGHHLRRVLLRLPVLKASFSAGLFAVFTG